MSKQEVLRQLVRQRLDLAAEEIFGLFERTIEEYEQKLTRSRRRSRQHRAQTAIRTRRTSEEEPGHWSHGEEQQDPELQPIKEEQEEVLTSQEGALPPELKEEEEERGRFRVTAVHVKSEDWQDADGEGPRASSSVQTHVSVDEDESVSDSESDDEDTDDEDAWQASLPDFGPLSVNGADGWTVGAAAESSVDGDERSSPVGGERDAEAAPGVALGGLIDEHGFSTGPAGAGAVAPRRGGGAGDKVFGCEVCGQRFNRRTNLRAHMRVHTGEKPFQCDDCGKRFRHPYNFRRHLRVHSGEKPFGCAVCSKRFSDQRVLSSHMSVHTGDKPFSCDVCARTFGKRSYLKTHMMVHTGEKPFGCGVCERRFTRKGDLKRHMLVHLRTGRRDGGSGGPPGASGTARGPPT